MMLAERDRQMADLAAWLGSDTTKVVVLEGPLGSGKTALMRAFSRGAEQHRRLFATCARAERSIPFGVVEQLLRDHRLPTRLRELVQARDITGLTTAVRELAEFTPLLLCVDDQRHIDQESLRWLTQLVDSSPVRLIAAERTDDQPPSGFALLSQAHRIAVPLLTVRGIADVAGDTRALEVHAATGGNPLLVRSFLQGEEAFRRAVLVCLHGSGPVALRVAGAAAVHDSDNSPDVLAAIAGTDVPGAEAAMAALARIGVLVDGRFRHPAARAAVLADLSPAERTDLHRHTARLLWDRGCSPGQIAGHLVQADHAPPWAIPIFAAASQEALADEDVQRAADLLKPALPSSPRLVLHAWQLDPRLAAPHLRDLPAAELGPADRFRLVSYLQWLGREEEARARAVEFGDDAWQHGMFVRPLAPVEPLATSAALANALLTGMVAAIAPNATRLLEKVGTDTTWGVEPVLLALQGLMIADRLADAAVWCDELARQARLPLWAAVIDAVRAEIACRQGNFAIALSRSRAALTHISPRTWGVAVGLPLGTLVLAATRTGNGALAAKHLARPVPKSMYGTRFGAHYLYARGHHHLFAGRVHAALTDFNHCGSTLRSIRLDLPGVAPWRVAAAETWLRLGDRDRAWRLTREQLGMPDVAGSRQRGAGLRVLAAVSPLERRTRMLGEASDLLTQQADHFELARVLRDLGVVRTELGDQRAGAESTRRAAQLADMCGARPLYDQLSPRAGDQDDDALAALSRAEQRVASLAASGHTNREIAEKLVVTVSTVEQHLTRVFRKLGVRRRRELASLVSRPFPQAV